jgi:hypothetical protein
MPSALYARYPMFTPSEMVAVRSMPGNDATSEVGVALSLVAKVTGSLPEGFTSPKSTEAMALPCSCPPYQASTTAGT